MKPSFEERSKNLSFSNGDKIVINNFFVCSIIHPKWLSELVDLGFRVEILFSVQVVLG